MASSSYHWIMVTTKINSLKQYNLVDEQVDKHPWLDFCKCQDRFGQISLSKTDALSENPEKETFAKAGSGNLRLVQNPTTGETNFDQKVRLQNRLPVAAEKLAQGKICPPWR